MEPLSRQEWLDRIPGGHGRPAPVWKTLPVGSLTPGEAFARIRDGRWAFLLESAGGTDQTSRYSFLGSRPSVIFTSRRRQVTLESAEGVRTVPGHPLDVLRGLLARETVAPAVAAWGLPPFIGGAVGYFGYGFARVLERLPASVPNDLDLPDCVLLFVDTVVAFDHHTGTVTIVSTPRADLLRDEGPEKAYARALERIELLEERLSHPSVTPSPPPSSPPPSHPSPSGGERDRVRGITAATHTRETYRAMVTKAQRYIAAGDIYQANLSQRFTADLGDRTPWDLYLRLRQINPSPFAAYLQLDGLTLASSSPERLVRLSGREADTRPIAGTRPRGQTPEAERGMRADLVSNVKERAEHLMLVDLERNDLGRVCDYGSIWVDDLMAIEAYSHVLHLVSNIRGRLRADRDAVDLLAAMFPGGTITGVPKIRCMEIIDELEPAGRGPYSGSIGYLDAAGGLDLNIIIRSFVITGRTVQIQVGAGIVADSDPDREYDETLQKAQALLAALND